jgi:hypothetical protein
VTGEFGYSPGGGGNGLDEAALPVPTERAAGSFLAKTPIRHWYDDEGMRALGHKAHEQCEEVDKALRNAVRLACRAGETLIDAKGRLPHGHFGRWLRDHAKLKPRIAQLYMQLARNMAALAPPDAQRVAQLSLREVIGATARLTRDIDKIEDDAAYRATHAASFREAKVAVSRARTDQRVRQEQVALTARSAPLTIAGIIEVDGSAARTMAIEGLPRAWDRITEFIVEQIQLFALVRNVELTSYEVREALNDAYCRFEAGGDELVRVKVRESSL